MRFAPVVTVAKTELAFVIFEAGTRSGIAD